LTLQSDSLPLFAPLNDPRKPGAEVEDGPICSFANGGEKLAASWWEKIHTVDGSEIPFPTTWDV